MLLGIVFYLLQGMVFPEAKTVIGPLSESRIVALQQQWLSSTGQTPTQQQLEKLIVSELDNDMLLQRALELEFHLSDPAIRQHLIRNMHFLQIAQGESEDQLFKQALELRLHLDDTVVKRRLVQIMRQRLLAANPPPLPGTAEIQAEFNNRIQELRKPSLYSFEHLFFRTPQQNELAKLVAKINQQNLSFQEVKHLGAPFIQGHKFTRQSSVKLAQNFGQQFVDGLEQATTKSEVSAGNWLGPVPSVYGFHYIWLTAFEPARNARLEEVEQELRADLHYLAQQAALKDAIARLRQGYDVRRLTTADETMGQLQ